MGDSTANVAARMRFRSNFSRQKEMKDEIKRLLQNGRTREALRLCDKALEIFPEHLGIMMLKTEAQQKLGLPTAK